jgi:hypothetical protein
VAAAAATSSALVNFNGVSSRDSQFTNFEQTFGPPDQGLCKGSHSRSKIDIQPYFLGHRRAGLRVSVDRPQCAFGQAEHQLFVRTVMSEPIRMHVHGLGTSCSIGSGPVQSLNRSRNSVTRSQPGELGRDP